MSDKDPNSPATTSDAFDRMIESWVKIQTVLDGTKAMRDAGRAYMPQHDNESDVAYDERLQASTLLNLSKLTLDSWVGRPFSDPMVLNDDVPEAIRDLEMNIDLQGNAIPVFARNWMKDGLAKGLSHCLIEMPRSDTEQRTVATDREEGIRPYWVHIPPEQLFFADSIVVNGEEVLTEIRIMESVSVREGFAMGQVPQIRQMVLVEEGVQVALWQPSEKKKRGKETWVVKEEFVLEVDRIPLVTFYADRTGLMEGTPPLEDLVNLNIAHWQSTSDQRSALTVARFPIITVTGGIDEGSLVVGPRKFLYAPDPSASFSYLEHSGQAIDTGRRDLHDLEAQMADYGAEFLKRRPGRETATARALESSESTSSLQDVTLRFMDAMQSALELTAQWLGLPEGGTVEISTDFAPSPAESEGLRVLIEARKLRDVSRKALMMALVRARILPEDFDVDADTVELEDEALFMGLEDLNVGSEEGGAGEAEEEPEEDEGSSGA